MGQEKRACPVLLCHGTQECISGFPCSRFKGDFFFLGLFSDMTFAHFMVKTESFGQTSYKK